ncbi:MAG: glycerol-3-phosphate acyltransferase [Aggregatilineales bacterium]
MNVALAAAFGFFAGALPFSVWIGRLALGKDIRTVGDGNPGATNVLKAGGVKWAAVALLLDFLKGALPVAIANFAWGFEGPALVIAALAPVAGHAFSPFLGFKGGKAVATSGGVWCGLTIWEVPTVGGLLLGFWFLFIAESGWSVILTVLSVMIYLVLTHLDPTLLAVAVGNLALLAWKHRAELRRPLSLRPWYTKVQLPWRL